MCAVLVLINRFTVTGSSEEFVKVFTDTAVFMRNRPGFLGNRLLRSEQDESVYVNIAEWADRESLLSAASSPEMAAHREEIRQFATPDPQMFSPVAGAAFSASV